MRDLPLTTSFWFDSTIETSPALKGTQFADAAIVGGGFAGLSAARHLKLRAPHLNIALVEARHVGFGASGRNAGWVQSLPPLYWLLDDLGNRQRLDDIRWTTQFCDESNAEIGNLVQQEAFACDWKPTQHVLVARNALEAATLRWIAPRFAATGLRCETFNSAQVKKLVGYRARAAFAYEINTVQPYRLARGLRQHCINLGVQIYENSSVARIQRTKDGMKLTTGNGSSLTAEKVILATDAYTKAIAVDAEMPSMSIEHTYMLATEPLEASVIDRICHARKPFGDATISYYIGRIHHDRLIFNGIRRTSAMTPEDDRHLGSLTQLYNEMLRRFPFLEGTPLAGAWGGGMLQTASDTPIVRVAADNPRVIFNIGHGGNSGVGMALLSGRLTTDLVLESSAPDPDAQRLRTLLASSRSPGVGAYTRAALGVLRSMFSS
jgi:glycine/D-amino acid oxidase-like deaminating enzyme